MKWMKYDFWRPCPKCGASPSLEALCWHEATFHANSWWACWRVRCPKELQGVEHFWRQCYGCDAVWFELPLDAEEKVE